MKILDLALATPETNLALDEALLEAAEEKTGEECLRFWESPRPFLVLGHGNRVASETQREACDRLGVPILRRCSGGGAVLQGPGCFNYALILLVPDEGPLTQITTTNKFIMERQRTVLERLLGRPVAVRGTTDLAVPTGNEGARDNAPAAPDAGGWLKFSGNAQRRKRRALLFHGSFLLHLDLELLGQVLAHPSQEPDYRAHRAHAEFVTNLPLSAADIKRALREAWRAEAALEAIPHDRVRRLVAEKYARPEWNFKF
jgi:lipoate---protein ligase